MRFSILKIVTVLAVLALIIQVSFLFTTIDTAPKFIDEVSLLQNAYFFNLLFLKYDSTSSEWSTFVFYDQPPVEKYILGLSLLAFNNKVIETSGGAATWQQIYVETIFKQGLQNRIKQGKSVESNQALLQYDTSLISQIHASPETKLTQADYHVGRVVMLCFGVGAALLLLTLIYIVTSNLWPGLIVALLFLGNSVTIPVFQQVLSDSVCSFFALLVILFLIYLLKNIYSDWTLNRRSILYSVALGLFLGLAMGTKFISMYLVVTVCVVYWFYCPCGEYRDGSATGMTSHR